MSEVASTIIAGRVHATEVSNLDALAARIRGRDEQLLTCAQRNWLDNGRDLIAAKRLVGHGGFEEWCRTAIKYSLRTAEKLMQAVRTFEPLLKSESDSDLPKASLVYALSAPCVPPEVRDTFAPRLVAGEAVGAEMRLAIKQHRDKAKRAKRRAALSPEEQARQDRREAAKATREIREEEQRDAKRAKQAAARSAAIDLIVARFGDDLPRLLALIAAAGPGGVFSYDIERELEAQRVAFATTSSAGAVATEDDGATTAAPAPNFTVQHSAITADPATPATAATRGSDLGSHFEALRQRRACRPASPPETAD